MNLFSQRTLADFLLERRALVLDALREAVQSECGQALCTRFRLDLPKLRTHQMKMSDSGVVPVDTTVPPGLDDEAEVAYLAQLIERLEMPPLIWAIVRVPFDGEAALFNLIPPDFERPRPPGSVDGGAILLRTEHRGRDEAWKQQLETNLVNISEHLEALEEPIRNFNHHIERLIRGLP